MPASNQPLIHVTRDARWANIHQSIGARVARLYDVWNRWSDGTRADAEPWRPGLLALQQIVREAQGLGKQVRAIGGSWSLSGAAVTRDFLVNTKPLNYLDIGIRPENCDPAFTGRPERLVFAQCGVAVHELNQALEANGLSLPTSGASDGQTICGAVSTGTHGAANQVGAMQDYILGLHVVADGGAHFWIERASRPVASQRFCDVLGARLVRDDRLFNAAVVSFGSFGLLHAVMFEAEPIYLLEKHIRRFDYDAVRAVIRTLDVRSLGLPDGDALPFHFEVVVNPYGTAPGQRGAYVRFMYKRDFQPVTVPGGPVVTTGPGDDLLGALGTIGDLVPSITPIAVDELLSRDMKEVSNVRGTHGQIFGPTTVRGAALSTELGVPLARVEDAVNVMVEVARAEPFAGVIAMRFVKASPALLAFTQYAPVTCTIELPSTYSARTRGAFQRIWDELDVRGIPFTFHWGQLLRYDLPRLRRLFGSRVDDWLAARRQFLTPDGRRTFSNDLLETAGLAD